MFIWRIFHVNDYEWAIQFRLEIKLPMYLGHAIVVNTHTLHFRGARARRTHSMRFYTCMHLCRYVHCGYRWATELNIFFNISVKLDISNFWVLFNSKLFFETKSVACTGLWTFIHWVRQIRKISQKWYSINRLKCQ